MFGADFGRRVLVGTLPSHEETCQRAAPKYTSMSMYMNNNSATTTTTTTTTTTSTHNDHKTHNNNSSRRLRGGQATSGRGDSARVRVSAGLSGGGNE